jgi:hypothetical protein
MTGFGIIGVGPVDAGVAGVVGAGLTGVVDGTPFPVFKGFAGLSICL